MPTMQQHVFHSPKLASPLSNVEFLSLVDVAAEFSQKPQYCRLTLALSRVALSRIVPLWQAINRRYRTVFLVCQCEEDFQRNHVLDNVSKNSTQFDEVHLIPRQFSGVCSDD